MIFIGSRYDVDPVFRAPLSTGSSEMVPTVIHYVPKEANPESFLYTWEQGDRLDRLAHRTYGNATLWWRIAEANPETLDPTDIKPGTVLVVPRGQ